jgi:hypothetical protein
VAGHSVGAAGRGLAVGTASRTTRAMRHAGEDLTRGFNQASPAMRSTSVAISSFAVTIVAARGINLLRERDRPTPAGRALGRLVKRGLSSNETRIHHYLPGIGLGFAAGAASLATHPRPLAAWLGVPFGVGVGLTTDELRVLAHRSDPYWGGQRFALAQAALAAAGSAGMLTALIQRGRAIRAGTATTDRLPAAASNGAGRALLTDDGQVTASSGRTETEENP